jgi:rhamnosyltransferase
MVYDLVSRHKLPFLKRKLFIENYFHYINANLGDNTRKVFDYIKNHTDYDVNNIWSNILRIANFSSIRDNMHLNTVLSETRVVNNVDKQNNLRSALFIYLSDKQNADYFLRYADSMPSDAKFFIVAETESIKQYIASRLLKLSLNVSNLLHFPVQKGMYSYVFLTLFTTYMAEFDVVCFIHDSILPIFANHYTIDRNIIYRSLENMLASKEYVLNVIHEFCQNPRLGLMFAPPVSHSHIRMFSPSQIWRECFHETVRLAKELEINVPINNDQRVICPLGGMMWFRPKALQNIIDYDWHKYFSAKPANRSDETFSQAIERLYGFSAQNDGFYSAWLMTEELARVELTTLNYRLQEKYSEPTHPELQRQIAEDKHRVSCLSEQSRHLSESLSQYKEHSHHLSESLSQYKEHARQLDLQRASIQHELETLRNSKSWKITAPLRKVQKLLRNK